MTHTHQGGAPPSPIHWYLGVPSTRNPQLPSPRRPRCGHIHFREVPKTRFRGANSSSSCLLEGGEKQTKRNKNRWKSHVATTNTGEDTKSSRRSRGRKRPALTGAQRKGVQQGLGPKAGGQKEGQVGLHPYCQADDVEDQAWPKSQASHSAFAEKEIKG